MGGSHTPGFPPDRARDDPFEERSKNILRSQMAADETEPSLTPSKSSQNTNNVGRWVGGWVEKKQQAVNERWYFRHL